ncbi:MAG: inorganic phosphate transporter, partial [Thermoprotei archaeon]
MSTETLYVVLGLFAALYIAWNLGANDAANPTNAAVGSGAIKLRDAILLFSLFAAIGAIVQGYMVMKTIGKGVVRDIDAMGALVASIAAGLWITLATWKGIPVSTTHSTVGAVLGIGFAYT